MKKTQATYTTICTDCVPPNDDQSQIPLPLDLIPGKEPKQHPEQEPKEQTIKSKNNPRPSPSQRKKQKNNSFPATKLHNKFPHQKNYRRY